MQNFCQTFAIIALQEASAKSFKGFGDSICVTQINLSSLCNIHIGLSSTVGGGGGGVNPPNRGIDII